MDRERKPRKVLKGTDKVAKHRKQLYNMLTDEDDLDNEIGEVDYNETDYTKRR
jgi:hypothetical protein